MTIINGKNYFIDVNLFWGSDETDIESTIDNNKNFISLNAGNIVSADISSSLANPFFHGSVVYSENRINSTLINVIDMPIVFGNIKLALLNGDDTPGGDNVPKPVGDEDFEEEIFVTGINSIDDQKSEFISFKIDFVSSDFIKFIANIKKVSTFEEYDKNKKPVKDVLSELFAAANLVDRFDKDSVTINTEIPYITTENDSLITALDYIYRKIFDFDFKESEGKTYCRIIYDHIKRKYKLWKFDDIGTKKNLDSKVSSDAEKTIRELVSVDAKSGNSRLGLDGKMTFNNSGDQSILFESVDNVTFIDYDYEKNEFSEIKKEKLDDKFIEHDDEFNPNLKSKIKLILNNAKYYKDVSYEKTFSTSRQNGSIYDIFTDIIFKSSFMRVSSNGSIGRKSGDSIMLTFNDGEGTVYEQLDGDYLITGINHHFETNGDRGVFRTNMDLYRPYTTPDSVKQKITF